MLSLYMVTHKDVNFIPEDRIPIFVGSGKNEKGFLRDNTGDNIAQKNKYYSELTAYYWIWKNDHKSDYVSIEHYRRFFMSSGCIIPTIASAKQIEKEMQKYDAITLKETRFSMPVREYYDNQHYIEDLLCAEEAIIQFFPEYHECFEDVVNRNRGPLCNMLVLSKENFDKYCRWLFKILFYVDNKTDLSDRSEYQQRAFGFLAERLMEVWIEANNLKIKRHDTFYAFPGKVRTLAVSMKRRIPFICKPVARM